MKKTKPMTTDEILALSHRIKDIAACSYDPNYNRVTDSDFFTDFAVLFAFKPQIRFCFRQMVRQGTTDILYIFGAEK